MNELLEAARRAAYKAGDRILEIYKTDFFVDTKSDGSHVTEADMAANDIIHEELSSFGFPILSEETADGGEARVSSSDVWIIDPIDGTSGFVDRGGDFAVQIALTRDHKPVLGVVYRPVKGVMWFAEKGGGAYKSTNRSIMERIKVSDVAEWSEIKLATGKHHLNEQARAIIDTLNIGGVVRVGSVGIKVGYIAEKRADVYFVTTTQMREWDVCAPHIILEEAGGKMTGLFGEELKYNKLDTRNPHGILASNGVFHDRAMEFFKEHLERTEVFTSDDI